MATAISELSIVLRAKADGLAADIQKGIVAASKKAEEAGKAIATGMAAGLAAAGATLVASFKRGVEQIDALATAAQKLGTSTSGLAALEYQAKMTDTAFEAVTKGLEEMQTRMAKGESADAIAKLGLSIDALRKKDPAAALQDIAGAISKIQDRGAQLAISKTIFGKGGTDLVTYFDAGAESLNQLAREAEILGLTLNDGAVAAIGDFDNGMNRLTATWDGFSRQLAAGVAPMLKDVNTWIVRTVQDFGGMKYVVAGVLQALTDVTAVLARAAYYIANAHTNFLALLNLSKAGWAAIGVISLQVLKSQLEGVGSLLPAFHKFSATVETGFRTVGKTVVDMLEAMINATIKSGTKAVETFVNKFRGAWSDVSELWGGEKLAPITLESPPIKLPEISVLPSASDGTFAGAETLLGTARDEISSIQSELYGFIDTTYRAARSTMDAFADPANDWGNAVQKSGDKAKKSLLETSAAAQEQSRVLSNIAMEDDKKKTERDKERLRQMREMLNAAQAAYDEERRAAETAFAQIQRANQDMVGSMITGWITGTGKMSDIIGQWAQRSLSQIIDTLLFAQKMTFSNNKSWTGILSGLGSNSGSGWVGTALSVVGSLFGGFRAGGGPVETGRAYVVGERGPEIFAPKTNGTIIPNDKLGGGSDMPAVVQHLTIMPGVSRAEMMSAIEHVQEAAKEGVLTAYAKGGRYRRALRQ